MSATVWCLFVNSLKGEVSLCQQYAHLVLLWHVWLVYHKENYKEKIKMRRKKLTQKKAVTKRVESIFFICLLCACHAEGRCPEGRCVFF